MYFYLDTGGSSLKCAATDGEERLFHTRSCPTDADIEGSLAYMKIHEKGITIQGGTLFGVAISSCEAVNCDSDVIGGDSTVSFIHGFSWKERI